MKKGQMKVQEMAFVLVAILIFFAMVALVYFSIRLTGLEEDVEAQREESAIELARKLADIPEFSWEACRGCIDMDKVFALKERESYQRFWDVDYLAVQRVYPSAPETECTKANYPECTRITLAQKNEDYGSPVDAFVALCRFEASKGGYTKCELGKVYVSARSIR